jgi:hypothetical protein
MVLYVMILVSAVLIFLCLPIPIQGSLNGQVRTLKQFRRQTQGDVT